MITAFTAPASTASIATAATKAVTFTKVITVVVMAVKELGMTRKPQISDSTAVIYQKPVTKAAMLTMLVTIAMPVAVNVAKLDAMLDAMFAMATITTAGVATKN